MLPRQKLLIFWFLNFRLEYIIHLPLRSVNCYTCTVRLFFIFGGDEYQQEDLLTGIERDRRMGGYGRNVVVSGGHVPSLVAEDRPVVEHVVAMSTAVVLPEPRHRISSICHWSQ